MENPNSTELDDKNPPVAMKQEEIAEETVPSAQEVSKNVGEQFGPKAKKARLLTTPEENMGENGKKIEELQSCAITATAMKDAKAKKTTAAEMEAASIEPPRPGVFPYRTKTDFCCTICNAHMNSIQMWENHIRGKRHLKNSKKSVLAPVPTPAKTESIDEVEGLYYIDTKGATSPPHEHTVYERPGSPGDSRLCRQSFETENFEGAQSPPAPEFGQSVIDHFDISGLTTTQKVDWILKLCPSMYPEKEEDFKDIQEIIMDLSKCVLDYEIRQLPLSVQQKLHNLPKE